MKVALSRDDERATRNFFEQKVADYMSKNVVSISPDTALFEANKLFSKHDFNSFPVMQSEKLAGVFSKFDFMRAFAFTNEHPIPDYRALMERPVSEFMCEELVSVRSDMPLTRVLQTMVEKRTRSFPVLSEGRLIGVISREDIMRALADSAAPTTEFFCRTVQSHLSV